MNTDDTATESPEASFAPPLTVSVRTDNMHTCELRIAGADGVAEAIVVPSDGNPYQALYRIRGPLEEMLRRVLLKNGVHATLPPDGVDADGNPTWQGEPHAPPVESTAAELTSQPETTPEATPTEPAAPAPKKKAAAKAKTTTE